MIRCFHCDQQVFPCQIAWTIVGLEYKPIHICRDCHQGVCQVLAINPEDIEYTDLDKEFLRGMKLKVEK